MRPVIYSSVAVFAVMTAIGWNFGGGTAEKADAPEPPSATRSSRLRPALQSSGIPAEADRKMAVIRNAADPAERMRAIIGLANSVPPPEFESWLGGGWFNLRDGPDFMLFNTLLQDRWLREDPEGLALWCMKDSLHRDSSEVLSQWGETDPQRALAFFKLHPNDLGEIDALASMAANHPDLALQRLRELASSGLGKFEWFQVRELFETLAENSPAAFGELVKTLEKPLRGYTETMLLTARMKDDFAGELRKLWARPDGFEAFESVASRENGMGARIVDELANLPASWRESVGGGHFIDKANAGKWWNADLAGLGFSAEQEQRLRSKALQEMASKDPETALALMADFTFPRHPHDSTPGSDHRWGVIQNALEGHPDKTEELIAMLNSEDDRRIAREALERLKVSDQEDTARKIETPAEWLEKAATIAPGARYSFGSSLRNLPQSALAALGEQFRSMTDEEKGKVAPVLAASASSWEFSPSVSGEAIRYLLANPSQETVDPDKSEKIQWLYASSNYAANLAVHDPEEGGRWVASLPEGQAKLWAQINLHATWKNYDPNAADQWLDSLPAATRAEVRKIAK